MIVERETYHHGDLRQALIDAALELVAEKDVSSLSLREVARKAGVSHAAPYRHFEDKEALLAAVAEQGFGIFNDALEQATQDIPNPLERLEAGFIAYVHYAIVNPSHYRILFGAYGANATETYPSLATAIKQAFKQFVDTIAQGQNIGTIRPGNPEQLAQAVWALSHGLAMLVIDGHLTYKEIGGRSNDKAPFCVYESLARFSTRLLMEGLLCSHSKNIC